MQDGQIYLTNCDREVIHIPGQVQSHGFLLVVNAGNIICFYSENIFENLKGLDTSLIGRPLQCLEDFILNAHETKITNLVNENRKENFEDINPVSLTISGKPCNLIISTINDYCLLEFEPAMEDVTGLQKIISRSISSLLSEKRLQSLLNKAAEDIKAIIGYDRIMIYRFAEDGHGEVIAEEKNNNLEPWLGLHYPASDIPKQARELYKLNLTRLIAGVYSGTSKIVAEATNSQPLNLTYSQLRAVSPVHIQYLKNMGVASSYSISLLHKNELWGLIACHNYTPKFIDYRLRESTKLIGQVISSALEFRINEEDQEQREYFKKHLQNLSRSLQSNASIEDALTRDNQSTILNITNGTGAVLIYDNKKISIGTTPSTDDLDELLKWYHENIPGNMYATNHLSEVYAEAGKYKNVASGLLVLQLSKELKEYILWFKPEIIQQVTWAGNPDKSEVTDNNGSKQLTPRNSFEAWSQSVFATSEKWSIEEIKSVTALQQELLHAINVKAVAVRVLNESLRNAYEELDTFSYTISHDLKNPLTAVKTYAQVLLLDEDIGDVSKEMLQRINVKADQMNLMMNAILEYSHLARSDIPFKKIHISSLVQDLIRDLNPIENKNKLQITVEELPDLFGDSILILQVFSNLITNAIKYSRQSSPAIIIINGIENKDAIIYSVKDNGIGIPEENTGEIFNLFYRLDNTNGIEGSGVGLAIVKRIMEKHNGVVWVESTPGKGSIFYLKFNKQ